MGKVVHELIKLLYFSNTKPELLDSTLSMGTAEDATDTETETEDDSLAFPLTLFPAHDHRHLLHAPHAESTSETVASP